MLAAVLEALPGGSLCTLLVAVALWGYVAFLPPCRAGHRILGAFLPLVVSVVVSDPHLPKSQTTPPQMVALLRRFPEHH